MGEHKALHCAGFVLSPDRVQAKPLPLFIIKEKSYAVNFFLNALPHIPTKPRPNRTMLDGSGVPGFGP